MHEQLYGGGSLFGPSGNRKYLNAAERLRFIKSAESLPPAERLFCLVLAFSGARISEALALTPAAIDIESGLAGIQTLKRRKRGVIRQVPLPPHLLSDLDRHFHIRDAQCDPELANERLWRFSRTTAWRLVKEIMAAANIFGMQASPKGLRHGFGVNAIASGVPLTLLQKWMGHASLRTTAIYIDVVGPDERAFAERMWGSIKRSGKCQRRNSRTNSRGDAPLRL